MRRRRAERKRGRHMTKLTPVPIDGRDVIWQVHYSGPAEWSFRRFILHNAALCKAAGGVEAFCIGSEMRSLTQIRGAGGRFVAVQALPARGLRMWKPPNFMATCAAMVSLMWTRPARLCSL